jgi:hypothetical protein
VIFALQQFRRDPVAVDAAPSGHDSIDQHLSTFSERPTPLGDRDRHLTNEAPPRMLQSFA